jgi:hypothetical protein
MHRANESEQDLKAIWAKFDQDVKEFVDGKEPVEQHTSSHLRALNREGYEMSLAHIISVAKGEIPEAPYSSRIRAHEVLARNGMGHNPTILLENRELLKTIYFATAKYLGDFDKFKQWMAEVHAALKYQP